MLILSVSDEVYMGLIKLPPRAITIIYMLFLAICALSVFSWFVLTNDVAASPSNRNESTGNVVAYNNHGKIVFITEKQDMCLKLAPVFGFGLIGIGFCVQRLRSQSKKSVTIEKD
jgi:hypothetical protein